MADQRGMQQSSGKSSRPVPCYNCGAEDHFTMACPEATRQIPAGLAAAKAAQAAQSSPPDEVGYGQQSYQSNKPRKFAGPIVTKYPPPKSGPVVTRYAVPPHIAQQVGPGYGGPPQGYPNNSWQGPYPGQSYSPPTGGPPNAAYGPPAPIPPQPYPQHYPQHGNPMPGGQSRNAGAQMYNQPDYGPPQQPGFQPGYNQHQQYGYPPQHQAMDYQNNAPPYGPGPSQPYNRNLHYGHGQPSYPPQHVHSPAPAPYAGPSGYGPPQAYNPPQGPPQYAQQWGQGPPAPPYQHASPPAYHQPYDAPRPHLPPQGNYMQPPYAAPPHQEWNGHAGYKPSPNGRRPSGTGLSPPKDQNQINAKHGSTPQHTLHNSHVNGHESDVYTDEEEFEWLCEQLSAEKANLPLAVPLSCPISAKFTPELPPPASNNMQGITSIYTGPDNLEEYIKYVRDSAHWKAVQNDPAFLETNPKCALIAEEELIAWMQEQRKRRKGGQVDDAGTPLAATTRKRAYEDGDEHDALQQGSPEERGREATSKRQKNGSVSYSYSVSASNDRRGSTGSVRSSATPIINRDGTPALETTDDAWAPQPGEGFETAISPDDRTEAILASLGVTGSPKPVKRRRSSSRTAELVQENSLDHHDQNYGRKNNRQDSGYVSARGSYSNGINDYGVSRNRRVSQQGGHLPPPPPPPAHVRHPKDSPSGSHQYGGDSAHDSSPPDLNSAQQHISEPGSPLSPTSAELLGEAPYVYSQKNGKRSEPLRQADDVTPKFKRRQPQVAEAYSRRW